MFQIRMISVEQLLRYKLKKNLMQRDADTYEHAQKGDQVNYSIHLDAG